MRNIASLAEAYHARWIYHTHTNTQNQTQLLARILKNSIAQVNSSMLDAIANERFDTHVQVQHNAVHPFFVGPDRRRRGLLPSYHLSDSPAVLCKYLNYTRNTKTRPYPSGGFVFPGWRNMEHATSGLVRYGTCCARPGIRHLIYGARRLRLGLIRTITQANTC